MSNHSSRDRRRRGDHQGAQGARVGAVEIAERLNVSGPTVVHNWRERYEDFPTPVVVRTRTILWYWPEIQRWAKATGRLEGHSAVSDC